MKLFKFVLIISSVFVLGCDQDPSVKRVPKDKEKKIIDKGLNDVTFNPAVDILFIVDDSFSMDDEQANMARNSSLFVEEIFKSRFIDYHIGVVTASPTNTGSASFGGRLVKEDGIYFVDRNTIGGKETLKKMLRVGTGSLGIEEFFSITEMALTAPVKDVHNKGFYREDAHLAVIYVTDTEDQSSFTVPQYVDFLLDLKRSDRRKIHLIGALVENLTTGRCEHESDTLSITKLNDAINEFNGIIFELCSPDYGEGLAKAAQQIVRGVSTVYLEELPIISTLKVTYDGTPLPEGAKGWSYDPLINAIRISEDTEVDIVGAADLKITFEAVYR